MMKISIIHPRDVIALFVLAGCGFLLWKGIDSFVATTAAVVVTYYFVRRNELHPERKE